MDTRVIMFSQQNIIILILKIHCNVFHNFNLKKITLIQFFFIF